MGVPGGPPPPPPPPPTIFPDTSQFNFTNNFGQTYTLYYAVQPKPDIKDLPQYVPMPNVDQNNLYNCTDAYSLAQQINDYNNYVSQYTSVLTSNYNANKKYCDDTAA